jgi:hypothetical protein
MPVNLSYPKPRSCQTKVIAIARTDSSTEKCVLPKGAVIVGVHCLQTTDAATNAASWTVGWSGTTTAILNAFAAATTKVGLVNAGTAVGAGVLSKLDSDKTVISTFGGTSTDGGIGYVVIEYFVPGPGEDVTS